MADDKPRQHTPAHLRDDTPEVFDKRHPAASSFAPVQPGAGVVTDDADEKGQNLAGGPTATEAQKQYNADDEVVLAHQGHAAPASTEAGGEAKLVEKLGLDKDSPAARVAQSKQAEGDEAQPKTEPKTEPKAEPAKQSTAKPGDK
jgi:hypothetical protein